MANAAADFLVRDPQATTAAPEPEAEGLHQPEPHTTTRPTNGPVLHCTTVHSSSSLPTLTLNAEHSNSFPLLTGTPPLPDPTRPSAGSLGERRRALARDMGHPLQDPPAFLEPSSRTAPADQIRGPCVADKRPRFLITSGFLITSAHVALAAALIEDDSWPMAGLHGRNHPSWENNLEVQVALGPTLANWPYSGKWEYVAPGHRVPIIIEPVGAVPKSSHPLFHLITDARLGNYIYAAWGSVYHSIDDAALSLEPFDFFYCVDPVDAYHTVAFAGCAQGIVIEKMIWIDQHGQLHVSEQRFLGCSPCTCTGACEESLSGICLG